MGGATIIFGAPNAVRGGSHIGSLAAADMVEAGVWGAPAAGFYYPALLGGGGPAGPLRHQGRLGRVGEALGDVPLAERSQALAQGADGMLGGVVGQVAGNALGSGREKTAPVGFEVLDGSLVAAPGVVTGGGAKVALDIGHGTGVDG